MPLGQALRDARALRRQRCHLLLEAGAPVAGDDGTFPDAQRQLSSLRELEKCVEGAGHVLHGRDAEAGGLAARRQQPRARIEGFPQLPHAAHVLARRFQEDARGLAGIVEQNLSTGRRR